MTAIQKIHLSDVKDCANADRKFLEEIRPLFKNDHNWIIANTYMIPYYIQELYFIKNENLSIPESIATLSQLKILQFNGNRELDKLPNVIKNCQSLREIHISEQRELKCLPEWIGDLPNLDTLVLRRLNITAIPESIGNCIQLKELRIEDGFKLKTLPDSIGNCTQLEVLDIAETPLDSVPDTIVNLTKLKYVIFSNTTFREIPWFIGWLPNLVSFDMGRLNLDEETKKLIDKYSIYSENVKVSDIKAFQAEIRELYPPPPEYVDNLIEPM
jgi:hypothetical protein